MPNLSGGAVAVLRSTRAGGVFLRCRSEGSAKPISIAVTVTRATASGASEAGGKSVRMRSRSSQASPLCAK